MIRAVCRAGVVAWMMVCSSGSAGLVAQAGNAAAGSGPTLAALVAGMKQAPGSLGVETARTQSGKQVVFAWFRDKESVARWYSSDLFRGVMKQIFGGQQPADPLVALKNDSGPVLVIASITLVEKKDAQSVVISQMAVELYRPASGGIAVGGRFAPPGVEVSGLRIVEAQ